MTTVTRTSAETLVSSRPTRNQSASAVVALAGGGYVITWSQFPERDTDPFENL